MLEGRKTERVYIIYFSSLMTLFPRFRRLTRDLRAPFSFTAAVKNTVVAEDKIKVVITVFADYNLSDTKTR